MEIGDRIKELRKSKEYTQKALAVLTGLAEITIRHYEGKKYIPKQEAIEKLASALGCSTEYLRYGTGRKHSNITIKEIEGDNISNAENYRLHSVIDDSILAHYVFFISDENGKIKLCNCEEEVKQAKNLEAIILNTDIPPAEKDRLRLEFCNALFKGKSELMTLLEPGNSDDDEEVIKLRKLMDFLFDERERFRQTKANNNAKKGI